MTPLQFASMNGNSKIVSLLLNRPEVDVNSATFVFIDFLFWKSFILRIFKTALHFACESNSLETVKVLLSCDKIINDVLNDGQMTPAMCTKNPEIISLFENLNK